LDLHDSSGAILLTVTQDLAANQKKVSSLTGLFGELPANGAYVRVRAGMPLAGFELFGDQSLEMMAGLVAE
ncbi:MAG: hypothetical protein KDC71_23190, partial [Acidobacteria bacterium]|nr:hypothetical protein [Acidobacteriota bacterium]